MADSALEVIDAEKLLEEYEAWFLRNRDTILHEYSMVGLLDIVDEPENLFNGLFPKFLEIEKGFDRRLVEIAFFNALFEILQKRAKRSIRFRMCFKRLISDSINRMYLKWKRGEEIDKREFIDEVTVCVYLLSKTIPYVGIYLVGFDRGDSALISKYGGNKLLSLSVLSSMKGLLSFIYLKSPLIRDTGFKRFFTRNLFSEVEALNVFEEVTCALKGDGVVALRMAIFIDDFLPGLWELI